MGKEEPNAPETGFLGGFGVSGQQSFDHRLVVERLSRSDSVDPQVLRQLLLESVDTLRLLEAEGVQESEDMEPNLDGNEWKCHQGRVDGDAGREEARLGWASLLC